MLWFAYERHDELEGHVVHHDLAVGVLAYVAQSPCEEVVYFDDVVLVDEG